MPNLPTRAQHERAVAAAVMLAFDDFRNWQGTAFPVGEMAQRVSEETGPPLALVFQDAARYLAAAESAEVPASDLESASASWATGRAVQLGAEIAARTNQRLGEIVLTGGDADALFGRTRAEGIGVTETTAAISAGEEWVMAAVLTLMLADSERYSRTWQTEEDGKVCRVCRPLNRKTERYWQLVAPHGPPAHPHCRCWLNYRRMAA